jgi:hypothetical protein
LNNQGELPDLSRLAGCDAKNSTDDGDAKASRLAIDGKKKEPREFGSGENG